MPVAAAAVTAIGAIIGSKMASNASKHATDAAMKGNSDALDYTKQQDAAKRAYDAAAAADYNKQLDAYMQHFYGYSPNGGAKGAPTAPAPGAGTGFGRGTVVQPSGFGAAGIAGGVPGTGTVGSLMAPQAATGPANDPLGNPTPQQTLQPSDWNDWRKYGVGA